MSSPPPHSLDLTIVSAKHLKNVNWRIGTLSPYAIFWIDPGRRFSTKSDDYNSTSPVWNERFLLPLPLSPPPHFLSIEIYHSRPSDTSKPLIGTVKAKLPDPCEPLCVRSFDLIRPSGRPQGKIKLKMALLERPAENYGIAPRASHYYPPPPPHQPSYLQRLYWGYEYPPSGQYSGAPSAPVDYDQTRSRVVADLGPPSAPVEYAPCDRSERRGPSAPVEYGLYDRRERRGPSAPVEYAPYDRSDRRGPTAPVEYTPSDWNEQRSLSGAMGGLRLDEGGVRPERESDMWSRGGYSDNCGRYSYN